MLDHIDHTNEPGILVSLDQEKAFDLLDRSFLMNILHRFGFGPDFWRWIDTLYSNASMKVIVNGYLTESILLERGVRQRDSLSPLLYILCPEVLANSIRCDPGIWGFLLPRAHRSFKIRQYADDSTCFVKDTLALSCLFQVVNRYELATGAKLNLSKAEAMWLGSWHTRSDAPFGLTWVNKMKIGGVWYSNGTINVDQDNWQTRLEKLETKLNYWKPCSLSFVLIVNVLGASKLCCLTKVLPLPKWVVSRYDKIVYPFVWGSKIETVSHKTLTLPFNEGGLALVDLITKCKALKVAATVSIAANSDTDDHYLLKYFIGSRLARLGTEWSHLRDNSTPSALTPTKFYDCVLHDY